MNFTQLQYQSALINNTTPTMNLLPLLQSLAPTQAQQLQSQLMLQQIILNNSVNELKRKMALQGLADEDTIQKKVKLITEGLSLFNEKPVQQKALEMKQPSLLSLLALPQTIQNFKGSQPTQSSLLSALSALALKSQESPMNPPTIKKDMNPEAVLGTIRQPQPSKQVQTSTVHVLVKTEEPKLKPNSDFNQATSIKIQEEPQIPQMNDKPLATPGLAQAKSPTEATVKAQPAKKNRKNKFDLKKSLIEEERSTQPDESERALSEYQEEEEEQSDDEKDPKDLYTPPYWIKDIKKGKRKPELRKKPETPKKEEPKITDPLELIKIVRPGVEEMLGFTDIDETKVYGLLTRSEMDPKKFFVRFKRNLHYYKTNFKLASA